MLTAFRLLKILWKQRFDGLQYYVNRVSMAQRIITTLRKQRFGGSKHYVICVSMAQNIM